MHKLKNIQTTYSLLLPNRGLCLENFPLKLDIVCERWVSVPVKAEDLCSVMQPTGPGSGPKQLQLTSVSSRCCDFAHRWLRLRGRGRSSSASRFHQLKRSSSDGKWCFDMRNKPPYLELSWLLCFSVWEESRVTVSAVGITQRWFWPLSILQSIRETPVGLWEEQDKTSGFSGFWDDLMGNSVVFSCQEEGGQDKGPNSSLNEPL